MDSSEVHSPTQRQHRTTHRFSHQLSTLRQKLIAEEAAVRSILSHELDESTIFCSITNAASLRQPPPHDQHHGARVRIPLYAPPLQRQRWGESTSLPHVNWGDLFFDLFYVAAAYNLGGAVITSVDEVEGGNNLRTTINPRGLLFLLGCCAPLWLTWYHKYSYDATYVVLDYFHRFLDVLRIMFISIAIVHVKSFLEISNASHWAMFYFCLGVLLDSLFNIALRLELLLVGRGGPELKREAKLFLCIFLLPISVFYLAAMIWAGLNANHYSAVNSDGGGKRLLGDGADLNYVENDGPVYLLLAGYFINQISMVVLGFYLRKHSMVETCMVPINVDFAIHRLGEWTMLMLGESVLGLLIVGISMESVYYKIVFIGVLTVVMIQDLQFESQPSGADAHAMKRQSSSGTAYIIIIQLYSVALIQLGASYKYMLGLTSFQAYDKPYSNESDQGTYPNRSRVLAGSVVDPEDADGSKVVIQLIFCISLAWILLTLELMDLSHKGLHAKFRRWFSVGKERPCNVAVRTLFVVAKIVLLIFLVALPNLMLSMDTVVLVSGVIVFVFIASRWIGLEVFAEKDVPSVAVTPAQDVDVGHASEQSIGLGVVAENDAAPVTLAQDIDVEHTPRKTSLDMFVEGD